jgi:prolyl-tRNA synthetase
MLSKHAYILKINDLLGLTSKDKSTRIQPEGQQFLIKAGYVQLVESSLDIKLLPLGMKLLNNLISQFKDLIPEYNQVDSNLSKADIIAILTTHIPSYKFLPKLLYNISVNNNKAYSTSKGLFYSKQSKLMNLYIIHDEDDKEIVGELHQELVGLLSQLKLNTKSMGEVGSVNSSQFSLIYPDDDIGEDEYLVCDKCNYSADVNTALFYKYANKKDPRNPKELSEVETPNCTTIDELAELLSIPKSKTAKIVFYKAKLDGIDKLIISVIRGDMDINEFKLQILLKADKLETADDTLIKSVGAFSGYASPIGIEYDNVIKVVDDLITHSVNLVAGANKEGYHLLNTNYGRDYTANQIGDIAMAHETDTCNQCRKGSLKYLRAVELISIQNKSSNFDKIKYIGSNGKPSNFNIFEIQIDLYKIMSSIVESNHDEYGIILPSKIAPYQIIIIQLSKKDEATKLVGEVFATFSKDYSVIIDDRKERSGVKFTDADLMGFPLKVIISDRNISNNQLELKFRDGKVITFSVDDIEKFKSVIEAQFSL